MIISEIEYQRRLSLAAQKAAQAWCEPLTTTKIMDAELCMEFAKVLMKYMFEPNLNYATDADLLKEVSRRVLSNNHAC